MEEKYITEMLRSYKVPFLEQTLAECGALKKISVDANRVIVELTFNFPAEILYQQFLYDFSQLLPRAEIQLSVSQRIKPAATQLNNIAIPNVKNIILVASGKGGVGKSTTTVNLACSLKRTGARVGILDGDIYGPNVPKMIGTAQQRVTGENNKFDPIIVHNGLQSISVAHMVSVNTAIVWRGPMMSKVLEQLLQDTLWDDLDYLFIDLPPGTGDIHLTLGQNVPVSGAVIVTTPQDVALLDARRGLDMFGKVGITVFGIIENMSQHICSKCGNQEAIFGHNGGQKIADECGLPLLGQLPLDIHIREAADSGIPIVESDPQGAISQTYLNIALTLAAKLSQKSVSYASKFPKVVVE